MSRILVVMLHPGFIRYFEGGLQALADAGHDVHVAFEINRGKLGEDVTAQRLAALSPRITCGAAPERAESVREFLARGDRDAVRSGDAARPRSRDEIWESLATTVRLIQDYRRFFEPAFAGASALRARAEKRLPRVYGAMVRSLARLGRPASGAITAWLRLLERLIPVPPALEAFVTALRPDVLVVTPLIELGSQQVDYVKCARRLGVPSVLAVASWDNLTSKGLVREIPDHVLVWNEAQRSEAVTLHGVAEDRVAVTGAVAFDRWFMARPSRSREEFCRLVGLDPDRPFVLYVGSSTFIAPDEVPFVERWVAKLRGAPAPAVASAGVLIRPHPANARQWRAYDLTAQAGVALWPPIGTDPTANDFWRDYFDSLHFSSAVVGINTSAQIEAAIVGRPVLTVQTSEFAHAQEGTLHFRHLVANGGAVRAASSLDEHIGQLADALTRGVDPIANREFVTAFVRPHGLEEPAAPRFAMAIAGIAAAPRPQPRTDSAAIRMTRPLGLGVARVARTLAEDRPLWVYAMRPWLTAAVRLAAVGYRLQGRWHAARLPLKRTRRALWVYWYESSQQVRRMLRRVAKPVKRRVRQAGGAARRAVRRTP